MSDRISQTAEPPVAGRRGEVPEDGGMMAPSITFLKVRGISIGAHWSWVVVAGLIAWSLGAQLFPRTSPGLDDRSYVVMGAASAIIFFGSILLHELGHAFQALKEGMKVHGITLWLFGGVARFEGMFPSAGAEFRIAVAGPIVSALLGLAFSFGAVLGEGAGAPEQVVAVASYLGRINLIVLAFNLVPALPLDGGRVLRAWLWHKQRSFTAATLSAAKAGKAFGYVLMGAGFLSLFSSAVTGGVWFIFLGFFLLQAAESESQYAVLARTFRPFKVRDLMSPEPVTASPALTVAQFMEWVMPKKHSTYPVGEDGRLLGLISIRMAGAVPAEDRARTLVQDVMLPVDSVPVLQPDTAMLDALTTLRSGLGRAVVLDDDRISGILSVSDVAKALELEQARGPAPEPEARSAGVAVWLVVTLLIAMAAAAFYHPPLAVVSPSPAVDISDDITIEGAPVSELNGRYLLLAVELSRPSALGALWALVHPEQDVVPISAVVPEGVGNTEYVQEQRNVFRQSQMIAAAAAARAAGYEVTLEGTGAQISGILPDSPASEKLRVGDVITGVEGNPVALADDLAKAIGGRPAGTTFRLTVEREGDEQQQITVTSTRLDAGEGSRPSIGVLIETRDFEVDLPFEIELRERTVGGPSAGLAYALAINDLLDPEDLANGRDVAASGTIRIDGEVGPVGGLSQKAAAAEEEGADILLVPGEEVDSSGSSSPHGVRTLEEAISILTGR